MIYIYIKTERERGVGGVTVTVLGNGYDDTSSKPGRICSHFT